MRLREAQLVNVKWPWPVSCRLVPLSIWAQSLSALFPPKLGAFQKHRTSCLRSHSVSHKLPFSSKMPLGCFSRSISACMGEHHVHVRTHMHPHALTHVCTHMDAHTCTHTCIHTRTHMHPYAHTWMYTHAHNARARIHACTHMYAHTPIHTLTHMHVHIHSYIYTHTCMHPRMHAHIRSHIHL